MHNTGKMHTSQQVQKDYHSWIREDLAINLEIVAVEDHSKLNPLLHFHALAAYNVHTIHLSISAFYLWLFSIPHTLYIWMPIDGSARSHYSVVYILYLLFSIFLRLNLLQLSLRCAMVCGERCKENGMILNPALSCRYINQSVHFYNVLTLIWTADRALRNSQFVEKRWVTWNFTGYAFLRCITACG